MQDADLIRQYNDGKRDFRAVNLEEAELSGADLRLADLRWAILTRAILDRADLTMADVSEEQLARAASLQETVLPSS